MLINGLCIFFREGKLVTHSFPGVQRLLIKFLLLQEQQGFSSRESSRAVPSGGCTPNRRRHHGHKPVSGCQSLGKRGFCTTTHINTLKPRQNWRHFQVHFRVRKFWIPIKIFLKLVLKGSIDNIQALDYIMAWRRPCDKPLSEPMVVNLPTHIWITRPQWVNLGLLTISSSII